MATDVQIARWVREHLKKPGVARLQLVRQGADDKTQFVAEWSREELEEESYVGASEMVSGAAQVDVNSRANLGGARYLLHVLDEESRILGTKGLDVEPDTDLAMQEELQQQPGGLAAAAMIQLLRHKEKDQAQQMSAMQFAVKTVVETNSQLMADRAKTNALLVDLVTALTALKGPLAAVDTTPSAETEARAVAIDKLTDGAVQHIFPALGEAVSAGTKKLLTEAPRRKAGRPKGSTKKPTNGVAK